MQISTQLRTYGWQSPHLFPNIRATVSSLYSLPSFPFTPGLSLFNRYMNIKAKRMTFCVTWVVERIVVTHFRNPNVGMASGTSGVAGIGAVLDSSTRWRLKDDSNQNRQVIYADW